MNTESEMWAVVNPNNYSGNSIVIPLNQLTALLESVYVFGVKPYENSFMDKYQCLLDETVGIDLITANQLHRLIARAKLGGDKKEDDS